MGQRLLGRPERATSNLIFGKWFDRMPRLAARKKKHPVNHQATPPTRLICSQGIIVCSRGLPPLLRPATVGGKLRQARRMYADVSAISNGIAPRDVENFQAGWERASESYSQAMVIPSGTIANRLSPRQSPALRGRIRGNEENGNEYDRTNSTDDGRHGSTPHGAKPLITLRPIMPWCAATATGSNGQETFRAAHDTIDRRRGGSVSQFN
jgi:hypothetical protein